MTIAGDAPQPHPAPRAATPIFDLLLAEVGVRWPGATASNDAWPSNSGVSAGAHADDELAPAPATDLIGTDNTASSD